MENKLQESIIKTLTYFDIFDYPVTLIELKKYCDIKITVNDEEFLDALESIYIIQESQGFYYLLGRESIIEKRLVRGEISIQKMVKAKIVSKILSKIPTIKLIGLSGSLSMNNSLVEDDIDLFFITQKNTLWLTRLVVSAVLLAMGLKRTRKGKVWKDKICPNMFMSENAMGFAKRNQNLYVAHEMLQLKVLFEKEDMYLRFLNKNKWVETVLPNGYQHVTMRGKRRVDWAARILGPIDGLCYILQKMYMKPVLTIERISKGTARFHPIDKGLVILELFSLKSKIYIDKYLSNQWIESDEARFYFDEQKMRILN